MENYIVVNEFMCLESFKKIYSALQKAFLSFGEELKIITNVQAKELAKSKGKNEPILFWDKDVYLAKLLEKSGYRCVNGSFAIETCDDKAKTYLQLLNKVPQAITMLAPFTYDGYIYSNDSFLSEMVKDFQFPLIVKENKGSFGAQVYLVNDIQELKDLISNFNHCEFLLQEFISSSAGKDIRVYVVGGASVAYAMRYSDNDFRSNVTAGGKMKKVDLPKEYLDMAIKATKCVGADFAGVDLLISDNGPIVCEVNSNAHFTALSECTGVDIAKDIAKYFLSLKK